jgi:predicted site-specific integrase-resolvase
MKRFLPAERKAIVTEVKDEAKKEGAIKMQVIRSVAKKHGIGFSTLTKWVYDGKVKTVPKKVIQKKKKKTITKPQAKKWETLFEEYISHRDAAKDHHAKATARKKELEKYVKQLK